MPIEYRVLVTIFTNEAITKEGIEQEVSDLLTNGGGLFSENSLDAHSVQVTLVEEPNHDY